MATPVPRHRGHSHRRTSPRSRLVLVLLAISVVGLMGLSFLAGWLIALGPVHQALGQLHKDIAAVQARRPLVLHPINWWAALGGFVLGMLVMVVGNHWKPTSSAALHPAESPDVLGLDLQQNEPSIRGEEGPEAPLGDMTQRIESETDLL